MPSTPGGTIDHAISPCFRAFSQLIGGLLANSVSPSRLCKVTHEINPHLRSVLVRCYPRPKVLLILASPCGLCFGNVDVDLLGWMGWYF